MSGVPKKLKKGELLFNEGDPSKAMYFIQAGTLRLFKRKGTTSIELGLIHKGEVIGEMGFLDSGPRSASAEAIHDVELVEINNTNLAEQMKVLPPWLMVLLKTVVNRLRSANNKIRQLETTSTSYTYGSEGVSTTYVYLGVYDVMKICISVLLAATRSGDTGSGGLVKVKMNTINKYANQIMGIHISKITEFIDLFEKVGIAKLDRTAVDKIEVQLTDIDQIDHLINYVNEENLKDHSKKISLSLKSVIILGFMVKHLSQFPPNAEGISEINLAAIIETEKNASEAKKEPFKLDETFNELVKAQIVSEVSFKDSSTAITRANARALIRMYRIQKIMKEVELLNEKKREQASRTGR